MKNTILGQGLSEDELKLLCGIAKEISFYKDALIFGENDPDDCLYLLFEGKIAIERRAISGHAIGPALIQIVRQGQLIGEMGYVEPSTRSATARAKSQVRLAAIRFDDLDALIADNPELGVKIFRQIAIILSRRLRRMNEQWVRSFVDKNILDEFEYM